MIWNYFKIALRGLRKYKVDSFVSLAGLSLGLACCIMLLAYVRFEWSYDNFHENSDTLFRVTESSMDISTGEVRRSLIHSYALSELLPQEFPEIESLIPISSLNAQLLHKGKFISEKSLAVGSDFLREFSFPLIYGNEETALSNIGNIVLTERASNKYFGKGESIGEIVTFSINGLSYDFKVTGVVENPPPNSSMQFTFLLPYENFFKEFPQDQVVSRKESLYIGFLEIWVRINSTESVQHLEESSNDFLVKYYGDFAKKRDKRLELQPLSASYFDQRFFSTITKNTNKSYSLILAGIALIIILIAGINFMSLTLSRGISRYHEIGVRKSLGAGNKVIQVQVILEVFISCSIAVLIGIALVELLMPLFESFAGKDIPFQLYSDPILLISITTLLLVLTLITGLYPAIYLSRKKAYTLFSERNSSPKTPFLIKSLIVVQFCLAAILMIGTLLMHKQLGFLLNKDLGFEPEHTLAIQINPELPDGLQKATLFRSEALRSPGIESISLTNGSYRNYYYSGTPQIGMAPTFSGSSLSEIDGMIISEHVDEHFLETLSIELLEGTGFHRSSNSFPNDHIIVNQQFVDALGLENPIGHIIDDKPEGNWTAPFDGKKILGVIKNYHFRSLYESIQPMALQHIEASDRNPGTILVRIANEDTPDTIAELENLWDAVLPDQPFQFNFLDELVQLQYIEELKWNRIIRFASFFSIVLSCFGLFALSSLVVQRKVKEIGIRKVFGASVQQIVTLVTKDFIKLVLLGFIIAIPIVWHFGNNWLQTFSYKTVFGMDTFVIIGAITLIISIITVSFQSIKAALRDPVESLRSE